MNDQLINRFSELFTERNEKFAILNSTIFISYNKIIVPFAPVKEQVIISSEDAGKLFNQLGGLILRCSGKSETNTPREWYAVVCNDFISIDSYKSKLRNEVNKGLSNCLIKRVDAKFISENGYEIYSSAISRYKNVNSYTFGSTEFSNYILTGKSYDDILHYWGIFSKNKLIGYSVNYVFGTTESLYSSIKIDPDHLNCFPLYALIYKMNQYYLTEKRFEYVNDGYRSILHDTNIQNLLFKKFNFKKEYLSLNLFYKPIFKGIIKTIYPFRKIIRPLDSRLNAVLELERISRST